MLDKIREYAKAFVPVIVTIVVSGISGVFEDGFTQKEFWILAAGILSSLGVAIVPNKPPTEP